MKKYGYKERKKQSWWYLYSIRTLVLASAITGFLTGFAVGYLSNSNSNSNPNSNSNSTQNIVL